MLHYHQVREKGMIVISVTRTCVLMSPEPLWSPSGLLTHISHQWLGFSYAVQSVFQMFPSQQLTADPYTVSQYYTYYILTILGK